MGYWVSPRVRTALKFRPTNKSDTAFWRQLFAVPLPPLKLASDGSQAISPAAAMTGSPPVIGVLVLVALGLGLAVKVGMDVTVGLTAGLRVAVEVGAAGTVGEAATVETDVRVGATLVRA